MIKYKYSAEKECKPMGVRCKQKDVQAKSKIQQKIDGVYHGRHYFAGGFDRCRFGDIV